MTEKNSSAALGNADRIIAEARRNREEREKGYREKALKLFPHLCASCGREFSGKKLRDLTVHHKDHNHDFNPVDGSNWELLCIYCHDNEHQRESAADGYAEIQPQGKGKAIATHNPFAALATLVTDKSR